MGRALHRLADELTAVLGGLIGYAAVLAALGIGVIYLLDMDEVGAAIETGLRADLAAVERPYVAGDEGPELRRAVAAK